MSIRISIFCLFVASVVAVERPFNKNNIKYLFKQNGKYLIKNCKNAIGSEFGWIAKSSVMTKNYNQTGWSLLEIQTNDLASNEDQAFAAGYLEGYLTRDLISLHLLNTYSVFCNDTKAICDKLNDFIADNFDWMAKQIKTNRNDVYWHQISLLLTQLNGLYHGYTEKHNMTVDIDGFAQMIRNQNEEFLKILSLQLVGDIDELLFKFQNKVNPFWATACSALIKVLDNNADVLIAHNTWEKYERMLRVAKHYKLKYHLTDKDSTVIPGAQYSTSSYPGMLISLDDFYITSANMVIMETAIGNSNIDLWKNVQPNSTFYWLRHLLANRLSQNGVDWADWFSMHNSGTYNDQWMIIDFKKFTPLKPPQDEFLIVLEQLPGKIKWMDRTSVLRDRTYWASYNLPYFDVIYHLGGMYNNSLKYGDIFSRTNSPRAKILERDHHKARDINSMMKLMRYNNYTQEPYAKCNCTPPYSAFLALSPRSDLNPPDGTYPYYSFGHRDQGAIDLKVTNRRMIKLMEFIAINGPTYQDVPPFIWSKVDFGNKTNHYGHIDGPWLFGPLHIKWAF